MSSRENSQDQEDTSNKNIAELKKRVRIEKHDCQNGNCLITTIIIIIITITITIIHHPPHHPHSHPHPPPHHHFLQPSGKLSSFRRMVKHNLNVKRLRMGHQEDVDYFEPVKRKDITDRHEGYHYALKKKRILSKQQ